MTEAGWLNEYFHAQSMLCGLRESTNVARTKVGRRKLRLFACGCCAMFWKHLHSPRLRKAVEVAERFAEGLATKDELEAAAADAHEFIGCEEPYGQEQTAVWMAQSTTMAQPFAAAFNITARPVPAPGWGSDVRDRDAVIRDDQKCEAMTRELLRDIFGNPFRPSTPLPRAILAWNGGTVRRLAETIYEERAFDRLPILADALLDAGCDNEELIAHCRSAGPHVRGCWAVDLILGKS
ncbi:MAG TPA: hypothetical protein VFW33_06170 [Gemmataceae bacterium]|nr:hypothetical protein [Gemmataceae bacterium]